jgi:integrase
MYTAMRRGEALGVRWEDIDGDVIHIRRNITHPQQNAPVITTPKTAAGVRDIPLVQPLAEILAPILATGYIVGGEKPLSLSAYRAMWERINKTINMHGAAPHVLRHSYLTYAVGETTDYKTVQGLSSHADLNTLLNTYTLLRRTKWSSWRTM